MEKFNTPQKGCTYIHIQTDILSGFLGGGGGGVFEGIWDFFWPFICICWAFKKIVYCYIVLQNRESNTFWNLMSWSNELQ